MTIFEILAERYSLGSLTTSPVQITGGRSHKIWHLKTKKGDYAVKQLLVEPHDTKRLAALRNAELLALELSVKHFPALAALCIEGEPIINLEDDHYIVYPWLIAQSNNLSTINKQQIFLIGQTLKNLHQLHLVNVPLPQANYSTQDWSFLLTKAQGAHLPYAAKLAKNIEIVTFVDNKGLQGFKYLSDKQVLSHGDLDPFNVLWQDNNSFILIDWELAHFEQPVIDYVATLLYWCLDGMHLSHERMQAFSQGYEPNQRFSGMITDAIYTVLGQWLSWFEFNLIRACETTDPILKAISINEAQKTLDTVVYLAPSITALSKRIEAY